jgi:hypothetical protein
VDPAVHGNRHGDPDRARLADDLRGSPAQMADELRRRRDTLGISYFSVNGTFIE